MTAAYLTGIALVTIIGLLVASGDPVGPVRPRRLLGFLLLWASVIGLGQPASRLTLDLAFVFGSTLTLLAATGFTLLSARRRPAPGPMEGRR